MFEPDLFLWKIDRPPWVIAVNGPLKCQERRIITGRKLGDGFGYFYFQPLLGDDWTL